MSPARRIFRRVRRIVSRIALILAALVLLVVATALILVHTDWGRNKIREQIVAGMAETFPCGVRIGAVEGSVVGDTVVRDVVLADCEGRDAIKIERLELNIKLLSLVDGTIRLEYLRAIGVAVDAHKTGDRINLVEMLHTTDEPLGWNIALDDIQVSEAAVSLDTDGTVNHFDGLELVGSLEMGVATVDTKVDLTGRWREQGAGLGLKSELHVGADGVITSPSTVVKVDGFDVTATAVRYAGKTDLTANVAIDIAEGALQRFRPDQLRNPAIALKLAISPSAAAPGRMEVALAATAGTTTTAYGQLALTLGDKLLIGGVITAAGANANAFVASAVPTEITATALIGVEIDPDAGAGVSMVSGVVGVSGAGTVNGLQLDKLYAHVQLFDHEAHVVASGSAPGEATARIDGEVTFEDAGAILIDRLHVVARVGQIDKLAPDGTGLSGGADVDVVLHGALSADSSHVTIDGRIVGHHVRYGTRRVARAEVDVRQVKLDLAHLDRPTGGVTVVATGANIDGTAVPTVTVRVDTRIAGGYAVSARTGGERLGASGAPWAVDLDAVVHPGEDFESVHVALGRYALRLDGVPWAGEGGTIDASARKITVEGVAGKVDGGSFAIDGTYIPGGAIDGSVRITRVDLAQIDRALGLTTAGFGPLKGEASLTADLHQNRGGRITGTIAGSVLGLSVREGTDPLDVTIAATIEQTRIAGTLTAKGARLGDLVLTIDVEPPHDLTDARAWARLERTAIRTAVVHAVDVDVVEVARTLGIAPPIEGKLSAELSLGPDGAVGELHARDVVVDGAPAMIDVDATFDLADPAVIAVNAKVALREIGRGTIDATLEIPTRPFDIAAWKALDVEALRGATLAIDEITLDEMLAARFKLGDIRGRIAASIEITEGAHQIIARAVARRIIGGPLARPIDLLIDATLDANGATATVTGSVDGVAVLSAEASAPIDPDQLSRAALAKVPITGAITILRTELTPLIRLFGDERKINGIVHGEATITGTVSDPTVDGKLEIEGLGGKRSKIKLTIDAHYAGGIATATLAGSQAGGGTVGATASYDHAHPEATAVSFEATKFQLGPLLRLIPNVVGVRGVVDAKLALTGIDPEKATVQGMLRVRQLQLPITDEIGAITEGMLDVELRPGHVTLKLTGKIEGGDVEATAALAFDGLVPRTGTLDVSIRDLAIISTMQPRIAADLHAELTKTGDQWKVDAKLRKGRVVIPDQEGKPLHPASPPADMAFIENGKIKIPARTALKNLLGRRPSHPFLRVHIEIEPIRIESKELRGEVGGQLDITAGTDGIVIDGQIEARQGEVMVFDRRYLLQRAALEFDGGIDPLLDIRMSHEFTEVTMYVGLRGRLSDPELSLTSSPGNYSEGQLLGFLLGGTPGGGALNPRDALTGAAASVASQTVGGFVTRKLPVKIDVLRFEPATGASSASFVAGKWVNSKLLVLIRSRIGPREDENNAETELEYWLGRRLLLDLVGGNKAVFGADLLWTRRW
jgi:hypothetical protein